MLEKVLTNDELRERLAIAGRRAVEQQLAAGPYADAIDEVYRKASRA